MCMNSRAWMPESEKPLRFKKDTDTRKPGPQAGLAFTRAALGRLAKFFEVALGYMSL